MSEAKALIGLDGTDRTHDQVIAMLITLARAAHGLADNTEDNGASLTVDQSDFDNLSTALDALDELPEPGENIFGTGPAKAEAFLAANKESLTWRFVREFSGLMERKLNENRHKGGPENWCCRDVYFLLKRLGDEVRELRQATDMPAADDKVVAIQREAADVANFAMMIATWYSVEGHAIRMRKAHIG